MVYTPLYVLLLPSSQHIISHSYLLPFPFRCMHITPPRQFVYRCALVPRPLIHQYYLYNWRCQPMVSPEVGLVLL